MVSSRCLDRSVLQRRSLTGSSRRSSTFRYKLRSPKRKRNYFSGLQSDCRFSFSRKFSTFSKLQNFVRPNPGSPRKRVLKVFRISLSQKNKSADDNCRNEGEFRNCENNLHSFGRFDGESVDDADKEQRANSDEPLEVIWRVAAGIKWRCRVFSECGDDDG